MPKDYIGGKRPDYLTIDSDSHVTEYHAEHWKHFPDDLKPFAPREFVDSTEATGTKGDNRDKATAKGETSAKDVSYNRTWVIEHSKVFPNADYRSGPFGLLPTAWYQEGEWANREGERDGNERLKDMDIEGVDVTFIFGNMSQNILCLIDNPEVAKYWCEAWNNWIAGFCKPDPFRIRGTALIPLHDVDMAVAEVKRAATELGLGGIYMPAQFKRDWTWKEKYYPIYEACQELNMPIALHQQQQFGVAHRRLDNVFYKHLFMAADAPYSVAGFIANGTLDTFPNLKVCWVEQGSGWLPWLMDRLEEHIDMFPQFVPDSVNRNPKEYFGKQAFIAFEPEEIDYVPFLEKKVGPDGLVFGTDYSHPDCISPRSVQNILDFPELSDESKKRVLSDNPARLWDINVNGNGH